MFCNDQYNNYDVASILHTSGGQKCSYVKVKAVIISMSVVV